MDDDGNLVITVNGVSGSGIPLPKTGIETIKMTGYGVSNSPEIQVGLSFTSLGSVSRKPIMRPMSDPLYNDSKYTCGQYSISVVENTTGNLINTYIARNVDMNVKKATGLTLNIPAFDVYDIAIEDGSYKMKVVSLYQSTNSYIGLMPANFMTIANECPDITFTVSNGTAHFNALNTSVPDLYYVPESISSPGNYNLQMLILYDMMTKA